MQKIRLAFDFGLFLSDNKLQNRLYSFCIATPPTEKVNLIRICF
jgi:hypothetical protein